MLKQLKRKLVFEFNPVESGISLDSRDFQLDFLKILAAFLVVFYHYAYYKLDYGFTEGVSYWPNLNRVTMCFAACSVPLFFLVNGILMFSKQRSWKDVYYKAGKILFLTFIWSFTKFPSWFFKTLAILYILFPVFQYLWIYKKRIYYTFILALLIVPFLYNQILVIANMMGWMNIGTIHIGSLSPTGIKTMYSIVYFLGGNVLANQKRIHLGSGLLFIGCGWGLILMECIVYTNARQMIYDGVNSCFPTLGALFLTVGLYEVTSKIQFKRFKRLLVFLSKGILPVYLFHTVFISLIMNMFVPVTLPLAIMGTILVYILCFIAGEVIRRIPVICCTLKI